MVCFLEFLIAFEALGSENKFEEFPKTNGKSVVDKCENF